MFFLCQSSFNELKKNVKNGSWLLMYAGEQTCEVAKPVGPSIILREQNLEKVGSLAVVKFTTLENA